MTYSTARRYAEVLKTGRGYRLVLAKTQPTSHLRAAVDPPVLDDQTILEAGSGRDRLALDDPSALCGWPRSVPLRKIVDAQRSCCLDNRDTRSDHPLDGALEGSTARSSASSLLPVVRRAGIRYT